LKVAFTGTAWDWLLAENTANAMAPEATRTEVTIPIWISMRFLLSPFFCCSRMALALARAASRCSDLVGLGVFEVILVVYRTILNDVVLALLGRKYDT
jgi:hypothetical protein